MNKSDLENISNVLEKINSETILEVNLKERLAGLRGYALIYERAKEYFEDDEGTCTTILNNAFEDWTNSGGISGIDEDGFPVYTKYDFSTFTGDPFEAMKTFAEASENPEEDIRIAKENKIKKLQNAIKIIEACY